MKKIKLYLYVLLTSLTIFSCRDAIDIVQDGEINNEVAFQKVADLRSFLNGTVYGSIDTSNEMLLGSLFTDEVGITPSNSGWYFSEHRYILNSDNAFVSSTWLNHYRLINRVNRLLEASERITVTDAEKQEFNSILAEARTLRAFAYLQLQSYFTTDMKDDNALGVILTTSVPKANDQLPRVKNGEIYSLIEGDLDFAFTNLKDGNSYKYVTKNLINAIRARMYAYRGKYPLAAQYAQAIVDNFPNGLTSATPIPTGTPGSSTFNTAFYGASTPTPYRQMWNDAIQGEVIFALSKPSVGSWSNVAALWTTNTTNLSGSPLFDLGRNLFNIFNQNNDIRRWAFVDPTSLVSTTYATDANYVSTDVLVIDKYPGKGNTPLRNDVKIFRLSEMYLILAEAAAAQDKLVDAATYIKKIRDARTYSGTATLPVYANKVDALKDVLKERRVELCLEGHRYVDLRRLGEVAGVSIDRNKVDDVVSSTPLTLDIKDHRFTFPIPQNEKLGNPSIVQNPGY